MCTSAHMYAAYIEVVILLIVSCPPGSYQINKRMVQVDDDGTETVVVMPECVVCSINTYQNAQGQLQCVPCPEYHVTRRNNTRLSEDCIMMCPPGEYSTDGLVPCISCPTGQYQYSRGQPECVECPENHGTRNIGSQLMGDCLPLCYPGEYSQSGDGFRPCDDCPCGSYSDVFGAVQCINCSTIGAPQDQCMGKDEFAML